MCSHLVTPYHDPTCENADGRAYRIMPAALVPRPWDFDLPPSKPDLTPIHEISTLEQIPSRVKTEDNSGRPSGDSPPVSLLDDPVSAPQPSEPNNLGTDNETLPLPSVTVIPPNPA